MLIFGLWAYRKMSMTEEKLEDMMNGEMNKPFWQSAFVSTSHCGAGCAVGDIIGEFAIFFFTITLFGLSLWASYFVDFILAYSIGIAFQYFAIVPMKHLSPSEGLTEALIIAFQAGMYAWMALTFFVLFHPPLVAKNPVFWFMMQICISIGFLTSYPANGYLVKKGTKAAMLLIYYFCICVVHVYKLFSNSQKLIL